jgi:predicted RNA-binding protein Jag
MGVLNKLELLKDMVQEAIDKGATTVEDVHRTIAEVPIEQLESSGLLDADEAQEKKELHHRTVGTIYDAIRRVNSQVGEMASELFEAVENGKAASDRMDEKDSEG